MGTWLKALVALHLVCVVGGFGYLAYSGVTLIVGRRRGAALGTLEVTIQVSALAELLLYGAFLFGVAAVGASSTWNFGQTWVWLALLIYLAAIGVLHGAVRRPRREYVALARKLASASSPSGQGLVAHSDVERVESLERRISAAWGAFNVLTVVAICLMVFKPGA